MFNRWLETLLFNEKIEKAKSNSREKPDLFNYQRVKEEQIVFDNFKNKFFNNLQLEVNEFETKYKGFYNNIITGFINTMKDIKIDVSINFIYTF